MNSIDGLELYKLKKKCLRVRLLQGKKISECFYYTFSKISQQISQKISANKQLGFLSSFY